MNNTRRRIYYTDSGPDYVLNAKDNPNIMALFYSRGICASPDGMTAEECAAVTDFSKITIRSSTNENFDAFQYFTSITAITINGFYGASLTSIKLPYSLKSIANDCLRGNTLKGVITFPSGFTSLGNRAIGYSTHNANCVVIFTSIAPPTYGGNCFTGGTWKIYVPDNSVDAYKAVFTNAVSRIHPVSEYTGS